MKYLLIGKFPPIQGGVSAQFYNTAVDLCQRGHTVNVVTNSSEIESGYRILDDNLDEHFAKIENLNIFQTTPLNGKSYIPFAKPYVTELFGLCKQVCEENSIDFIVGYYFEPYAFVATLISKLFNIPVIITHAGSDLGKLSKHPNLAQSYSWILNNVDVIVTRNSSAVIQHLKDLNAPTDKFVFAGGSALPAYFKKKNAVANLEDIKNLFQNDLSKYFPVSENNLKFIHELNKKNALSKSVTIGIYGKMSPHYKSIKELIDALSELKVYNFKLVVLLTGTKASQEWFLDLIREKSLENKTFIFPPLAPWEIPSVISNFDIIPFLENNFPVQIHTPVIPREGMSVGSCILMSKELYDKQFYSENLVDTKNFLLILDPTNPNEIKDKLKLVLADLSLLKYIKANAKLMSNTLEEFYSESDAFADAIHDISIEFFTKSQIEM